MAKHGCPYPQIVYWLGVSSIWRTGLSKVAGCLRQSPPTWLVSAGYSTWHLNKISLDRLLTLTTQFYFFLLLQATPGTSPVLQAQGWGIVWNSPVPGLGVGPNKEISSPCFAKHVLFLARFTRWLQTSRLPIFKANAGICRRVLGEE